MNILAPFFIITIIVIIDAVIYGWVKSKYESGYNRDSIMFPVVLVSAVTAVLGILGGPLLTAKVLGMAICILAFGFVLYNIATFISNYSERKFSRTE